jgi:signal transduction histidine kinase
LLDDLSDFIIEKLPLKLGITQTAMILLEENICLSHPSDSPLQAYCQPNSSFFSYLKETPLPFINTYQITNGMDLKNELNQIRNLGFTLIFPLKSTQSRPGFLFVGMRKDGRFFTEEDIHLFLSFASQTAIAIENATRYERLKESKKQLEEMFLHKVHKEKMVIIGEMSTMLAHELKTPLGIIHSSAQYLDKGKQSETVRKEMLHYIMDEVEHLSMTISSLLGLARQRPPAFSQADLNQELPKLIQRWCSSAEHRSGIDIECRIPEYLPIVYLDLRQITQVIHNLIRNSEDAMQQAGKISVQAGVCDNSVKLAFEDTGPGIPMDQMNKVFHTFFTTKEKGLGLGLAASRQIIASHNGRIFFENLFPKGLRATICLPIKPLATGATETDG